MKIRMFENCNNSKTCRIYNDLSCSDIVVASRNLDVENCNIQEQAEKLP
jgi:hypothetical protein